MVRTIQSLRLPQAFSLLLLATPRCLTLTKTQERQRVFFLAEKKKKKLPACRGEGSVVGLQMREE
jgi:hypothetical protein